MNVERDFLRAVARWDMVRPGDRVLVGASGGKDSLALAWLLGRLRDSGRLPFELSAARIAPKGSPVASATALAALHAGWGIAFQEIEAAEDVSAQPSCWRCSAARRQALIRHAREGSFTVLALGHHLDDILTTALMNMVGRGQAPGEEGAGMPPVRHYPSFGLRLVRPLALVPEESILRLVRSRGWDASTCTCPFGVDGDRAEYRRRLDALTASSLEAKRRLFRGLGLDAARP